MPLRYPEGGRRVESGGLDGCDKLHFIFTLLSCQQQQESNQRNAVQGGEVSAYSVSSLTEITPTILSLGLHFWRWLHYSACAVAPYTCPQADYIVQFNSEGLGLPKA